MTRLAGQARRAETRRKGADGAWREQRASAREGSGRRAAGGFDDDGIPPFTHCKTSRADAAAYAEPRGVRVVPQRKAKVHPQRRAAVRALPGKRAGVALRVSSARHISNSP